MKYEEVDENIAYKNACENVKKIAKAIMAIKIKYFHNFNQITEADKKIYDELYEKIEQISQEHGLNNLKVALMQDISQKYDEKKIEPKEFQDPKAQKDYYQEIMQAYYGTVEVEKKALKEGNSQTCLECQKTRKEYLDIFNQSESGKEFAEEAISYLRGTLINLDQTKENIEDKSKKQLDFFAKCNSETNAQQRKDAFQEINEVSKEKEEKTEELSLE